MLPLDWAEKSFVLFCRIGEQQLLRYCNVFLHDDFRIVLLAWFVHQRYGCKRNFHFNFPRERRNIEMMTWDTISDVSTKAILKWTDKILFSDRPQGINRLFYRSFIMDVSILNAVSVVSIDSSWYQNELVVISEWKFPQGACGVLVHNSFESSFRYFPAL